MDENEDSYIHNITLDILLLLLNQTNSTFRRNALHNGPELGAREILIIVCYSLIVVVSVFGNSLVCNIVARKANMRRTTYVFIANLAFSDLLMTVMNVPFNVARVLLENWPFGGFMCTFVPLVQVTSVYVSTYTMMFIAIDRYRVICKPLKPRLTPVQAYKVIGIIWLLAITLSLPHGIFNKIEELFTYRLIFRCRTRYPYDMNRSITLITFFTQYVLPLSVTGMAYLFLIARVWSRDALGVVTEAQLIRQAKAKWKTIRMLMIVVILFAVLWLPLNVYNLIDEFTRDDDKNYLKRLGLYNSTLYFICHWLAMSSLCCNPFIYCWLNKNFRSGAYSCLLCLRNVGRKLNSSFRSTTRDTRLTDVQFDFESQSYDSRTDSVNQSSKDISVFCNASRQHPDTKSKSLRVESRLKCAKETIPMEVITEVTSPSSMDTMCEEKQKKDYHSFPDMETALNAETTDSCFVKKCSSWNEECDL